MVDNGNIFVTYKWLFATAISILLISLSFVYFVHSSFTSSLSSKADIKWVETRADGNSTRINTLCLQLEKMENKQDEMLKELYNIKAMIKR